MIYFTLFRVLRNVKEHVDRYVVNHALIQLKDIRILPINWLLRPRLARLRNSILFIDDFDGEFSVCVCNVGKKIIFY